MTIATVFARYQLREVWIGNRFIFLCVVYIDVVESHQIEKVCVVDHTEAKQLVNTGLGRAFLELGQPTIRDTEPLVAFDIRDSTTRLFDVANSDVALIAKAFEFLTSRHSSSRKPSGPSDCFKWVRRVGRRVQDFREGRVAASLNSRLQDFSVKGSATMYRSVQTLTRTIFFVRDTGNPSDCLASKIKDHDVRQSMLQI